MGIDYYLVAPAQRVAYELGKGGLGLGAHFDAWRRTAPSRSEFDAAVRDGWLGFAELSRDEYEAELVANQELLAANAPTWRLFQADRWLWDADLGIYILRNHWTGGTKPEPTDEEAKATHRSELAYATEVAEDIWSFVDAVAPGAIDWSCLELHNDSDDLPWGDFDGHPWYCVGTRYRPKYEVLPYRLDDPMGPWVIGRL